jgi:hypothetical protein
VKYDPDGILLWERQYDAAVGAAIDVALALDVSAGRLCVAGQSWDTSGTAQYDCSIVMYDLSGNLLWDRMYNGPGNTYDGFASVRMDASGNVFATGASISATGTLDLVTLMYTYEGDQAWVRRQANGRGWVVDLDATGSIYVTGQASGDLGGQDYITIRYDLCGCSCPGQGDSDGDGQLTSLDLGALIDILFAGVTSTQDPCCHLPRFDLNCDGYPTALDLSDLIDHLFAGGAGPCDPCSE